MILTDFFCDLAGCRATILRILLCKARLKVTVSCGSRRSICYLDERVLSEENKFLIETGIIFPCFSDHI